MLKSGGVTVPNKATVHGMVIDSKDLLKDSALISDDRTLNFKVKDFINDFQVSKAWYSNEKSKREH